MTRANPGWDRLTFSAMRRLQARRLRHFLCSQVLPFSTHYRRLWEAEGCDPRKLKRVSDLARLPLTTKADLARNPKDFVLAPTPETIREFSPLGAKLGLLARRIRSGKQALLDALTREYSPTSVFFTTGRTAGPTPVLLAPRDEELLSIAGGRIADVIGVQPPKDRGLCLFPCAPHLAFWQVVACGRARDMLMLHTGGGRAMGTAAILRLIGSMKPTFLVGVPGYTYHLLRIARDEGIDLSPIRLIATGGDSLTPALRARIEKLLPNDVSVVSVYGFTEARQCWAECAPGTGFHTSPDLGVLEVIDPETEETLPPERTGELVFTGLDGRGSALVRYRTGDIAHGGITYARCPHCGRTVPRVSSALTRRADGLVNIKGTLVDLNVLADAVAADEHVQEWLAEITEAGGLEIFAAMPERARDALAKRVRAATEVRPDKIHVLALSEIVARLGLETQLKETRVLDRRKSAAGVTP